MVNELKMANPEYPVTHKQMPRFMYPEGHVLDIDNAKNGLFEGHYLIAVGTPIHPTILIVTVVPSLGSQAYLHCTKLRIE